MTDGLQEQYANRLERLGLDLIDIANGIRNGQPVEKAKAAWLDDMFLGRDQ